MPCFLLKIIVIMEYKIIIIESFLWVRHALQNDPVRGFYKGGNRGTERLSHLSKVTQLLCGRGGIGTMQWGHRAQAPNPCSTLSPQPRPWATPQAVQEGSFKRLSSSLPAPGSPCFHSPALRRCTWVALTHHHL